MRSKYALFLVLVACLAFASTVQAVQEDDKLTHRFLTISYRVVMPEPTFSMIEPEPTPPITSLEWRDNDGEWQSIRLGQTPWDYSHSEAQEMIRQNGGLTLALVQKIEEGKPFMLDLPEQTGSPTEMMERLRQLENGTLQLPQQN